MPVSQQQFANAVTNLGGQLIPYTQNQPALNRPYMYAGVCFCLCLLWIRNTKLQEQNLALPTAAEGLEELSWLAEQQNQGHSAEAAETYLRAYGLRPDGSIVFAQWVNWQRLNFFVNARQGFYVLGATPPGGNGFGHAIALNTRNTYQLFDPNYGTATFGQMGPVHQLFNFYWPLAYPNLTAGPGTIFRYV